eukprot:5255093-Amphidinium_carterae.1
MSLEEAERVESIPLPQVGTLRQYTNVVMRASYFSMEALKQMACTKRRGLKPFTKAWTILEGQPVSSHGVCSLKQK